MLKKTKNEGLKALFECTGIDVENLNTYHIGFVIGYVSMPVEDLIRQKSIGTAQCTGTQRSSDDGRRSESTQ